VTNGGRKGLRQKKEVIKKIKKIRCHESCKNKNAIWDLVLRRRAVFSAGLVFLLSGTSSCRASRAWDVLPHVLRRHPLINLKKIGSGT